VIINDALPPEMLATFLFTMACTLVLAAVMVAIRYRIETLADEATQSSGSTAEIVTARGGAAGAEPIR
jgi:hypothetical protein